MRLKVFEAIRTLLGVPWTIKAHFYHFYLTTCLMLLRGFWGNWRGLVWTFQTKAFLYLFFWFYYCYPALMHNMKKAYKYITLNSGRTRNYKTLRYVIKIFAFRNSTNFLPMDYLVRTKTCLVNRVLTLKRRGTVLGREVPCSVGEVSQRSTRDLRTRWPASITKN